MKVLAFDFGASSGRGIVGELKDGKINIEEIHRFSNDPVQFNKHLQWDFLRLIHEVKQCLFKCKNKGIDIESIGVDTWGVDYGLVDNSGELINNPYHYRDSRTEGMIEKVTTMIPKEELIRKSGIDCLPYNTIYQLMSEKECNECSLKNTTMLLMPDLFNYFLTGEKRAEFSIATTTQLYDYEQQDWNTDIIKRVGLPESIFPPIINSGEIVGDLKPELKEELGFWECKVVAVGSHDTSSAISAIPAKKKNYIFIATGTWIMVGCENDKLIMNNTTIQKGLSNEGGVYPSVNLLRNTMGLWLLQECKRQWNKEGQEIGFSYMVSAGAKANTSAIINPDDLSFYQPGKMPQKIREYCRKTNQVVPETIGEIVRVIEESLALRIKHTILDIQKTTGKAYDTIHMFGGGIQDELLCQTVANATGKVVITGPKEATTMGNIMTQLIALGEIKNIQEGRKIVRDSINTKEYKPFWSNELEKKYKLFSEFV